MTTLDRPPSRPPRAAKQQKKLEKVAEVKQEQGKAQVEQALRRALTLVNAEPGPSSFSLPLSRLELCRQPLTWSTATVPESPEGKEQFFMEQVALGEQLAARCASPSLFVSLPLARATS